MENKENTIKTEELKKVIELTSYLTNYSKELGMLDKKTKNNRKLEEVWDYITSMLENIRDRDGFTRSIYNTYCSIKNNQEIIKTIKLECFVYYTAGFFLVEVNLLQESILNEK